jgi:hypothetical protein
LPAGDVGTPALATSEVLHPGVGAALRNRLGNGVAWLANKLAPHDRLVLPGAAR